MKPHLLFVATLTCFSVHNHAYSQLNQIKLAQVSGNNINARIHNTGVLFSDMSFSDGAAFEVPIGSNSHAFCSAALTMGGLDSNQQLRAASAYRELTDYAKGPLTVGGASRSDSVELKYNRIWQVNRNQVTQHRNSFSDPTYAIPIDILEWPAHGDTTAGYDFYLAPFVDVNQNGVYEPRTGDYPDVKGDFSFYFINNDGSVKNYTSSVSMGVEIHCMVYGYSTSNPLNEALFVDYKVINRSRTTYTDFYIGQFVDPDLGNYTDDYIEADVSRGMVFVKNGDSLDDNPPNGQAGYGIRPGAAGVLVLKGPYLDSNRLDDSCLVSPFYTPNGWGFKDDVIDNERLGLTYFMPINNTSFNNGMPDLAVHHYSYMRGIWQNGLLLNFGGNGFFPITGPTCRIAYFGDTDPTYYSTFGDTVANDWTEDGNNPPGDRLAMLSSGPITFTPQEELDLTYAFIFARDTSQIGVNASVDTLKSSADFVREFYFTLNRLSNCFNSVGIEERSSQNITVYPVPTSNYIRINNLTQRSNYQLFSLNGKLMKEGDLSGSGEQIDLSGFKNGVYIFHLQNTDGLQQIKVIVSK